MKINTASKIIIFSLFVFLSNYAYAYRVKYVIDPSSSSLGGLGNIYILVSDKRYTPTGTIAPGDSGYFDIPGNVSYPFHLNAIVKADDFSGDTWEKCLRLLL